jgi:hypothetical protein
VPQQTALRRVPYKQCGIVKETNQKDIYGILKKIHNNPISKQL